MDFFTIKTSLAALILMVNNAVLSSFGDRLLGSDSLLYFNFFCLIFQFQLFLFT